MAPRTTSGIGDRVRRAFTLMEVLAVIALLGLATVLVTVDFGSPAYAGDGVTPYETLSQAVESGRGVSPDTGLPARLFFDGEAHALKLVSGESVREYPLPPDCLVRFALPSDVAEGVERPLESLEFHASGCVTPAVVILVTGGVCSRYRLEPFSAAMSPEVSP